MGMGNTLGWDRRFSSVKAETMVLMGVCEKPTRHSSLLQLIVVPYIGHECFERGVEGFGVGVDDEGTRGHNG